jgi:hypothetical protein
MFSANQTHASAALVSLLVLGTLIRARHLQRNVSDSNL